MPRVVFTRSLERFVACPPRDVAGGTVREALEAAFADNPRLRGYVLDDRGLLRRNVTVFVGGEVVRDRDGLSDAAAPADEIYVMQALAGG